MATLLCGRGPGKVLEEMMPRASSALEARCLSLGFCRSVGQPRPAASVDFELLAFVAARLGDPDARFASKLTAGVPLGWSETLPRTPVVFHRKERWSGHDGATLDHAEWVEKYRSASDKPDTIAAMFAEQRAMRMMAPMTYAAAQAQYGERLRIVALERSSRGRTTGESSTTGPTAWG